MICHSENSLLPGICRENWDAGLRLAGNTAGPIPAISKFREDQAQGQPEEGLFP
jgi:hypothetical protein